MVNGTVIVKNCNEQTVSTEAWHRQIQLSEELLFEFMSLSTSKTGQFKI